MFELIDKTYNPKSFERDVYEKTVQFFEPYEKAGDVFVIMMPPPNVTGKLHVGHSLTYMIQDILIRYYRQKGRKVLWQPGIDHAGIATQMVVERTLEEKGIKKSDMSREEFINVIWEWKEKSGGLIAEQQKLLGCSAPWNRSRFTMDESMNRAVRHAFVRLYKDGLIYRDKRFVNWDTKFKTAISDLEIVNKEEKGILWHIKYNFSDGSGHITVATTRPETMFGDTAVAVHPNDERYKNFIGKMVKIPFTNREIPVIADEYVDMEKGSGCLKITPAHDHNDFMVGKRHNLEIINILDEDGHMENFEYVPEFIRGIYLKKARKEVLERLKSENLLIKEEEITHSMPYGDRSNTVIEPLLKEQWFVDAKTLSVEALRAVQNKITRFIPEKWENTYYDWLNNIQPWCISRQIVWGHQIPAWFTERGDIIVEETEEEAKRIGGPNIRRDTDVLDTWFSSALWPFATLGWPENTPDLKEFFPTSVLVTGFDIIFFWIARMMMMSLYFMREVPFRDIYIHALVRDEKGQKMSKSKGNVLDPIELMEEYGADALRFTLAFFSVPGRDIKIGKEHIKISRNFITKIWNAARFLQHKNVSFEHNIKDLSPKSHLNKWVIAKLKKFQEEVDLNIKEYRFDYLAKNIQIFLRETFCDFFIEALKIVDTEETKNTAGAVFQEFLRIAHPVIPFVTDHLAQILGITDTFINKSGVHVNELPNHEESERTVDQLIERIHVERSSGDISLESFSEELKKLGC
ncbi:MAG: valine--tRNA ligase [Holosporales bacterium]|jgi:valyl-tRNA synthetase|nr:valine--tRNA ligase [Holosporales bacterium]